MQPARRIADLLLEGSIVGSFSRLGYSARRDLQHWPPLTRVDGKLALITGATSGIGQSIAIELATLGARVHFLARDETRARSAQALIVERSGNAAVDFSIGDLNDLRSIRDFAVEFASCHDRLDVLVHNAGALHRTYGLSVDGVEQTIATHVVAPFALTTQLLSTLRAASDPRVITVSSGGMYSQRLDISMLEMPSEKYDGVVAYARAKRAQVVLNGAWAERERDHGAKITFSVMHPGWVATPGVSESLPGFERIMRPLLRTPRQGADTAVWLATVPHVDRPVTGIWLDRSLRWEHKLPWTRSADEHLRAWLWCTERLGALNAP